MSHPYTLHNHKVDAAPEEVDYKPEKLDLLDELFAGLVADGTLQCMNYLMARHGKVFAWKSMGRICGYEDRGDFMPDSIRRIASTTKIFTAVAVMQLIERGKFFLEQPVHTIIDEFKTRQHDRITIFHLLTHTSGLTADSGYFLEPYGIDWWSPDVDASNWIRAILGGTLQSEPGKTWSYCSRGFNILGEIITRTSGMPYEDYVTKNILEPLGMEDSFFQFKPEKASRICFTSKEQEERHTKPKSGVSAWYAGGGLFSTLHDLWKFSQMVLNKGVFNGQEILSRKTAEAMTRNHLVEVPAFHWGERMPRKKYGLGWEFDKDPMLTPGNISHEGAGRSSLWIDPTEDFVFIYFEPTNLDWAANAMICPRAIAWSGLK